MNYKKKYSKLNKKIDFIEASYIEKNYMKGDKAIIPVQLEKAEDLYMKHDYKKIRIAESVCNYIEKIANMIDLDVDIIIEIHCPELEGDEQKEMIKSIKNNYRLEMEDLYNNRREENHKSIILLLVGILLLAVNILVDQFFQNTILSNFICVVWWVAIWDMIELQTLDKSEINMKQLKYQQLYDAEIMFVFPDNK